MESQSLIGTTISHYRVLERLGGGGIGVVYKAEAFIGVEGIPSSTPLLRRPTVAIPALPPGHTPE